MTATDADLVIRAVRGERAAFDRLIGPRWERIFRIALRITGNREEAEDVAQQACLRVWSRLGSFRIGEDLDAWIYRMVVNLAIDALRREKARPTRPAVAPARVERPLEPVDQAPGPEQQVLARELERALEAVTADLPPRQKAVFVLTRIEGFSAAETARILGVAPSTVRNHLFQLRAQIARRLQEEYPGLLGLDGGGRP